jgi:hypothetical protein
MNKSISETKITRCGFETAAALKPAFFEVSEEASQKRPFLRRQFSRTVVIPRIMRNTHYKNEKIAQRSAGLTQEAG